MDGLYSTKDVKKLSEQLREPGISNLLTELMDEVWEETSISQPDDPARREEYKKEARRLLKRIKPRQQMAWRRFIRVAASLAEPHEPLPWGEGRRIALFTGSRRNEVTRLLPDVLAGAAEVEERLGPCTFILPAPTEERAADIRDAAVHVQPQGEAVDVALGNVGLDLHVHQALLVHRALRLLALH